MYKINFFISLFLFIFLWSCSTTIPVTKKYLRQEWPHWTDSNNNCLNTRSEILKDRSISKVIFNKTGCKVKSGLWNDYYHSEKLTQTNQIDIDHLVPLKHAHEHGASSWPREKKEIFANDPENLVITHRKFNRAKGPKGIDEWLPVKIEYACKYVKDWVKIKNKYGLEISKKEEQTMRELKSKCAF